MTAYNIFVAEGFRDTVIINVMAAFCSIGMIMAGFKAGSFDK